MGKSKAFNYPIWKRKGQDVQVNKIFIRIYIRMYIFEQIQMNAKTRDIRTVKKKIIILKCFMRL